MTFDREKLKQLILHVCRECRDTSKLGATKLHKVLWYSDGQYFVRNGEPITGETYIKREYGPFSTHLDALVTELQAEGKLTVREVEFHGKLKKEFIAKTDPNMSHFSEKELLLIRDTIKNVCEDHTATSISEKTHNAVWDAAIMYERIPYEALWAARGATITNEDIAWAKAEYGYK
jgi:hypothetical protein